MHIVFADQPIPKNVTKSLFLAGPSPRDLNTVDWRHEAINYLKSVNFSGTIFVPIPEKRFHGSGDLATWNYHDQVEWECRCRHVADIILFWVPRSIEGKMPAFVTNIEFGEDLNSGKIVYGRPVSADKCKYLDKRILDMGLPVHETLEDTFNHAIGLLGDGAFRQNGEVYIPLFIWQTDQFQSWYSTLKLAGNILVDARLKAYVGVQNKYVFSYILWVNIWVEKEQRYKSNEIIYSRKDISSVVAYYRDGSNIKIVLVKEFRSTVNNAEGFVYELPSGSSDLDDMSALINAQQELSEEVGLFVNDVSRFIYVGNRQLLATVSTHSSTVYKIELTKQEYQQLVDNSDKAFHDGSEHSSEITYISIVDIKDLASCFVDYSTIGMIYSAVLTNN